MGAPCQSFQNEIVIIREGGPKSFSLGWELLYCCFKSHNFMIKVGNVSDESRGCCFLDC
ncbi:hypothetical protein FIBSPDRAFT_846489 [Athelia psychrophila]|uniref:Uncharacterized protein n=1 Tax=Athelia psychrophila TaxID=1759441 RepID=A0A166X333_9AGAM|nr:hypothetical protein FIBSPDRAFT_846489 [Fibularhizoctonia sp. CBS 109695]